LQAFTFKEKRVKKIFRSAVYFCPVIIRNENCFFFSCTLIISIFSQKAAGAILSECPEGNLGKFIIEKKEKLAHTYKLVQKLPC